MQSGFINKETLVFLEDRFKRYLQDKRGINIAIYPKINIRKIIFENMNKVAASPESKNVDIMELQKETLRQSRQDLFSLLENLATPRDDSTLLHRERRVFGDRPLHDTGHILPEPPTIRKEGSIVEHFESAIQERESYQAVAAPPMFKPEALEQAFDVNTFETRLNSLMASRDTGSEVAQTSQHKKQKDVQIEMDIKSGGDSRLSNTFMPSDFVERSTPIQAAISIASHTTDESGSSLFLSQQPLQQQQSQQWQQWGQPRQQLLSELQSATVDPLSFYRNDSSTDVTVNKLKSKTETSVDIANVQHLHINVDTNGDAEEEEEECISGDGTCKMNKNTMGLQNKGGKLTKRIVPRFVHVNSFHRNFHAQPLRYQYTIKFSESADSYEKINVYQNQRYIPSTITHNSSGLENKYGYIDDNGVFRPPYDPAWMGDNEILYTKEIRIPMDTDANTQTTLKNIRSVEVNRVILPLDITSSSDTYTVASIRFYRHNFNVNYPYISMQIDEFGDIYDGTDDTIRRSFCQLIVKRTYQNENGRGYVILKPAQKEKKVFYPSPLSILPSLNVSFRLPNGDLFNYSRDDYKVAKIFLSTDVAGRYSVQIAKNYDRNEFYVGDHVVFRDFNMFRIPNSTNGAVNGGIRMYPYDYTNGDDVTITQNIDAFIERFNGFINRPSGHIIKGIADPIATLVPEYNLFYIDAPTIDGTNYVYKYRVTPTSPETDPITQFNAIINASWEGEPLENGKVINMSLQNNIFFKVETLKTDSVGFS
jgi:hypothetical protein